MVASGIGVTLLPEMAVPVEVRPDEIAVRPFAAPAPVRRIGLAWRPQSPRKAAFRVLAEVLEPQI
jgi:LysR family hydrogen peroxide-inducible transcriptional activator